MTEKMQTAITALVIAAVGCRVQLPSLVASNHAGTEKTAAHEDDDSGRAVDPTFPPALPDPTPPAFRDEDGVPQGPGGPISAAPRDCGPAHDHCLRANGYFASGFSTGAGSDPRWPVFQLDHRWYAYAKGKEAGGTIYRTRPATAENLNDAREIYVFLAERHDGRASLPAGTVLSAIPQSEQEALTAHRWTRISIYQIDAKAGTYVADDAFTYEIAATRVAFDPKGAEQ
jgi:hypothetical protein